MDLQPYAGYIRDDVLGCGNGPAVDDVITATENGQFAAVIEFPEN
jgi:hypothetical protein